MLHARGARRWGFRGRRARFHISFTSRLPAGHTRRSGGPDHSVWLLTTLAQTEMDVIRLGPLQVMPSEHMVLAGGHTLMLSGRELDLMVQLARHAGRIVAREELSQLAWGRDLRAGDRSVDVYVRKLRVKLEQAVPGWQFIHTHVGFGYRLAPVRSHDPHTAFTEQ